MTIISLSLSHTHTHTHIHTHLAILEAGGWLTILLTKLSSLDNKPDTRAFVGVGKVRPW